MHSFKFLIFAISFFALSAFSTPVADNTPSNLPVIKNDFNDVRLGVMGTMIASGASAEEVASMFESHFSTGVPTPC
eukprot:CAMPEP_0184718448 /NCGR_PEP_ID=MMETSP0314-20130426/7637_1 /TAXON_ID=38298 /ORGANISM="Rhodella maculata, Strain CCMP 736" /LENGTH=75 /DNA_ID=CAMNT_0027182191 /DNA_START=92 /DNA_END=319 /DNA_ORIENTATION=+